MDQNPDSIEVGTELTSACGVVLKVKRIVISGLWKSVPHVQVTYDYDDNGRKGTESVSIGNFWNNINE